MASKLLGHNADTDATMQVFQTVKTYKLTRMIELAECETNSTPGTEGLRPCNFRERGS